MPEHIDAKCNFVALGGTRIFLWPNARIKYDDIKRSFFGCPCDFCRCFRDAAQISKVERGMLHEVSRFFSYVFDGFSQLRLTARCNHHRGPTHREALCNPITNAGITPRDKRVFPIQVGGFGTYGRFRCLPLHRCPEASGNRNARIGHPL